MKKHLFFGLITAIVTFTFSSRPNFSETCQRKLCIIGTNVENFFDPTDTWFRRDWLAPGWTQELVDERAERLARLISQDGQVYADLHVLSEIESITALNSIIFALYDKYKMKYRAAFLGGGRDERGIQVAMLVKTEGVLGSPAQQVPHYPYGEVNKTKGTRNILELVFDIHPESTSIGAARSPLILEQVHFFGVHLPSLLNPTEARIGATEKLRNRINQILSQNPAAKIMIVGDFNTVPDDVNERGIHPIDDILLKPEPDSPFAMNPLIDVYSLLSEQQRAQMPPGTYFYLERETWSRLDRILVTRNFIDTQIGLQLDPLSFQHYAPDFATVDHLTKEGLSIRIPKSWELRNDEGHILPALSQEGITDHHPVLIQGVLR